VSGRERLVLGVDLGERRIGLAVTDPSGVLASPHATLGRAAERADDHRAIVAAARAVGATCIVVGLPRSLSGEIGPAARSVLDEVASLTDVARADGIEVDTYDERFSTMIAQRNLRAATPRRRKRQRAQRERIDASAAAVILQSWLDAHARPDACPAARPETDPDAG
jgi:putative holliday junction resolvase